MNRTFVWVCLLLMVVLPLGAEVAVTPSGNLSVLPSSEGVWTPVRNGSQDRVLNPWGDLRGDLPPVLGDRGRPEVVWAAQDGDYDVLFARWDGDGWRVESLSADMGNEWGIDFLHDGVGNRYVGWMVHGSAGHGYAITASSNQEPEFMPPLRIGGSAAQVIDGAILLHDDSLLVAWIEEREGSRALILGSIRFDYDGNGVLLGGHLVPEPFVLAELLLDAAPVPLSAAGASRRGPDAGSASPSFFGLTLEPIGKSVRISWIEESGDSSAVLEYSVEYQDGELRLVASQRAR